MEAASKGFTRRRFGMSALALAGGALLASCASIAGPRRVELSQARLQSGLERRFPLNKRILELFDLDLARPQLTIQPETDRVVLALDVSLASPLMRKSWNGSMALSGHLDLDPSRNAVFLTNTHVDRFDIAGIDGGRSRELERAADLLMSQLVHDVPVYSFRPDDLRYAGVQFVPTRLETAPGALFVTLEPSR